jgi:hypothetical protein
MPNTTPPAPPAPPALTADHLNYTIRSPWNWVMKVVAQTAGGMTEKATHHELVSCSILQTHVDETPRRRKQRAVPAPCTLRLELIDYNGKCMSPAYYGISCALDGLEDKDELVRTIQRCRAEHLEFSPPSVLIKWDVQENECHNILNELPVLSEVTSKFAVLKEPMGSRGEGIYFVQSVEEMYQIIKEHRDRALHEGDDFLDSVMAQKGRIPSWGTYRISHFNRFDSIVNGNTHLVLRSAL